MLKELIETEDVSIVQKYLEKHKDELETIIEDDDTPFTYACYLNQYEIIDYLISIGSNIFHKDDVGKTGLYWLVWEDNIPIVEKLINMGLDLKDCDYIDGWLNGEKNMDIFHLLVENGAFMDTRMTDGSLYGRVKNGNMIVDLDYIVEKGAFLQEENRDKFKALRLLTLFE
jgi:hypothetical protein